MRFLIGFVIVLGLAAGIGLSAGTGDAPPAREPSETPEAQIGPWVEEAEPELLTKLAEAEAAAAEERWGDAALTWQQVLDTAPPRLVKVRADTPNTFCDVREAIRIRLSTLPPDGLAAYRRASDPAAGKRFGEALTDPRDAPLADVWKRYAITSFGPRALLVLADRALRRGDLDVAVARLETLAYYLDVAPSIDRAGVLLRRAWCRARRGERYELSILQEEAKALGETEVTFRGRTTTVTEAMDALSRLEETDPVVDGWPLPGGSADRNRRARPIPGRLGLLGHFLAPERDRHIDAPDGPTRTERTASIRGDAFFVKDPRRLLRFRMTTGGFEPLAPVHRLDYLIQEGDEPVTYAEARNHPAVVLDGMVVTAHESPLDDIPASMLIGLGLAPDRDPLQLWVRGGGRFGDSSLDGEPGDPRNPFEESFYSDISFAGSPALWGGRLFVSGAVFDRKIGVHLLCLDPRPEAQGKAFFHRLVGYGTALGRMLATIGESRAYPGSPTVKDGIVYVSTNLGAVAALDALTGEILWLHRYPRAESRRVQGQGLGSRPSWKTDYPIAAEGAVFFTPSDSDHLLVYAPRIQRESGLVLRSDRIRRTFPGSEIAYQDLLGVVDGVLFLTGQASPPDEGVPVEARKAWPSGPDDQREDVWVGDPPESEVTGRGFLTEDRLVIPTRKGIYAFPLTGDGSYEVVALDEDLPPLTRPDGRPHRVFGNLTPAGNRIISVTADGIFVFGPPKPGGSSPPGRRR